MKLLVIGSGGREHALAWKLAQSPRVSRVFVAPGNAGTALEDGVTNVALSAIPELVAFASKETITLTVVGPEAPLAAASTALTCRFSTCTVAEPSVSGCSNSGSSSFDR